MTAFSFALLASLASALVLVVQAQPGFISIDCGASNEYTDENTSITYKTDDGFIGSGRNVHVSTDNQNNLQILNDARIFPVGTRNCYTLRPDQGKNRTYLIRASFGYWNYDGEDQDPDCSFDLHIDVNYWSIVRYPNYVGMYVLKEIMYVSKVDDIQVCLVNTGNGMPFISALELRPLDDDIYTSGSGLLRVRKRLDLGRRLAENVRYPDDVYDREWSSANYHDWSILSTTSAIDLSKNNNAYKVPKEVLRTAQGIMNSSPSLYLRWTIYARDTGSFAREQEKLIVYLHFMEIERLMSGLQREFTISLNDNQFTETVSLEYLKPVVVVSPPISGPKFALSINWTNKSGNPPILNAFEYYKVGDLPNVPTAQDDVKAINDIKATYHIKSESWQGDPCVPSEFTWDGLNCSYENPPRIISLKLSYNSLVGDIISSLWHLSKMEYLDLSNNKLTGTIPETLAELPNLSVLLTGNADLCLVDPCLHKKKQNTIHVSVVKLVSGFFVVLLGALAIIWFIKRKQIAGSSERMLRLKNRPFEYREVSKITGNFGQVIGEGGFGKVYHGTLDDGTVVAVKMLSESSKQGYKEFQAEAQLLVIVHHRNLVSLFGYCDDSKHMALIYEYMANGNLRQHLSDVHLKVLTWTKRLQIAVDAAQGLDYLHNGCKPPIIHRDLKTSNILLNEDFRAKIADFGLSRTFAAENDSHVSTHLAGTFGYLGPEFQSSGNCDKKSDVYSFGIVLFELITGQPAVMRSWDDSDVMHILQWVIPIIESGDIQRLMDPRLQGVFNINMAWKAVEIAMSCTQPRAIERPDINHALAELMESLVSNSSGSFEVTSSEILCDSVPMAR
ncbi:hypothetical protein BT93_I0299 [Corymbia citriodora subsp. variegata]|nr:hypothetical protein BT93_I0299 [Corymbia citriodora subsp. variegata]